MIEPLVTILFLIALAGITKLWRDEALSDTWYLLLALPGLVVAVILVLPLYRYWMELMSDETGWFFIIELFVTLLVVPLSLGLLYVASMLLLVSYRLLLEGRQPIG